MKKIIFSIAALILTLSFIGGAASPVAYAASTGVTNTSNAQYTLLAPLPCIPGSGQNCSAGTSVTTLNIQQYISYIFKLAIAIAVFLAVVVVTFGGFKYMTEESITGKGAAKKMIEGAIFGLLGALGSWLILYTINPQLVDLSLVTVPTLNLTSSSTVLNSAAFNASLDSQSQTLLATFEQANAQTTAAQSAADEISQQLADHCNDVSGDNDYTDQQCTDLQNQLALAQSTVVQDKNKATIAADTGAMNLSYLKIMAGTAGLGDTLPKITQQYQEALAAANANNDIVGQQTLKNQYALESSNIQGKETLDAFVVANVRQNKNFFSKTQSEAKVALQQEYAAAAQLTTDPATLKQLQAQQTIQINQLTAMVYAAPH